MESARELSHTVVRGKATINVAQTLLLSRSFNAAATAAAADVDDANLAYIMLGRVGSGERRDDLTVYRQPGTGNTRKWTSGSVAGPSSGGSMHPRACFHHHHHHQLSS